MKTTLAILALMSIGFSPPSESGEKVAAKPASRAPAADLPALNREVLAFARDHLGKQVGNGECATLAAAALRKAGARRFPLNRADGDYIWGRPIESFRDALPGDLLQFRDAVFQGKTRVSSHQSIVWRYGYTHHTAVIAEVRDKGALVTILQQNVGDEATSEERKSRVQEGTLRPASLKKGGKVWIYRPVGPDEPIDEPPPPKAAD